MLVAAAVLFACIGDTSVSDGGGTETGNGTVQGLAAYSNGQPAVAARVSVRASGYLAQPGGASLKPGHYADGRTDGDGHFTLKGLKPGDYVVEVLGGDGMAAATSFTLVGDSGQAFVVGDMTPASKVMGTLRQAGGLPAAGLVQIYGLERWVETDAQGRFEVNALPEGIYALHFQPKQAGVGAVDLPKVVARDGNDYVLGDYELPPRGCEDLACDTLQVKALLAGAGFSQILPESVMVLGLQAEGRKRVVELNLKGLGLTVLPDGVGQLSALRKLDVSDNALATLPASLTHLRALRSFDAFGNRLQALPDSIGAMRSLQFLVLRSNHLKYLPVSIGRLVALELLDLQDNVLADLPLAMTALGPLVLALDGNALCTLSPSLITWVLRQDPTFSAQNQVCPAP
jgi:Leucine rich repeat